jgi:outer membrane murein-binding lipoprotein Lpp
LGDKLAQLRSIVDATEARFQRAQEEEEKATEALQKEKYEDLIKL